MLVFKKADGRDVYSHIECNVKGCKNRWPGPSGRVEGNILQAGWFIAGGNHRCPEHVEKETQSLPPEYRK